MRILLFAFICILNFGQNAKAYDLPYIGNIIEYKTNEIDTFVHVARDYNLGFTEMRAANPYVDPWLPGEGTEIILPTRHLLPNAEREGLVINLAEMRLYAYLDGQNEPLTFPIGIGREGLSTPMGKTKITRKKEGPTWRPTARMRKEDPELKEFYPPGHENPLGTHALYLGWPTYAIHGTNRPFGIGRRISSGCIRMYPETITKLFEIVPVGTPVEVINQPVKMAWIGNELFLEAHPTLEQAIDYEEKGVSEEEKITDSEMKNLITIAGKYEDRLNWPVIRAALKERKGYPVKIARRPEIEVTEQTKGNESESDNLKTAHTLSSADILEKIYANEDKASTEKSDEKNTENRTVSYSPLND